MLMTYLYNNVISTTVKNNLTVGTTRTYLRWFHQMLKKKKKMKNTLFIKLNFRFVLNIHR